MKIAYIVSDFGLISETFIQDLAFGLADAGSDVTVFCNQCENPAVTELSVESVQFMALGSLIDRVALRLDRLFPEKGHGRRYQRYIRHAHRQLLPVLKCYQPDVAYIDYGTVATRVRSTLQALQIPFVVHFHGVDISSALNNHAYRQELQQVFRDAKVLIVASDYVRRLLVLEGASPEKIQVVRLGINLESLAPMSWNERKNLPPAIVFLGRFTAKKHPVALIEAFAILKRQVPDAQLTMIGDGPEMPRVKHRIKTLGLKNSVILYGALPHAEALAIMNRHWGVAQHSVTAPSGDQEGFGLSLAEAAALELPVVSTLHNGIPEQVTHAKTGFLVQEFDYEAMADYFVKLLLNPDLAEKMGCAGREKIALLCPNKSRIEQIDNVLGRAAQLKENCQSYISNTLDSF